MTIKGFYLTALNDDSQKKILKLIEDEKKRKNQIEIVNKNPITAKITFKFGESVLINRVLKKQNITFKDLFAFTHAKFNLNFNSYLLEVF